MFHHNATMCIWLYLIKNVFFFFFYFPLSLLFPSSFYTSSLFNSKMCSLNRKRWKSHKIISLRGCKDIIMRIPYKGAVAASAGWLDKNIRRRGMERKKKLSLFLDLWKFFYYSFFFKFYSHSGSLGLPLSHLFSSIFSQNCFLADWAFENIVSL